MVLIDLLDFTGGQVRAFFQSLDPHSPAAPAGSSVRLEMGGGVGGVGLDQDSALQRVQIQGERRLGRPVLSSLAVMA